MEYRMKCDVCGNIFCYTDEDLKKNEEYAKMARINALGSVFSAMGGTPMQTHHMTGQANLHSSKIVDYTQCPHCHSRCISVYTGDDTEKASTAAAVAVKSINTSASADSLLKRAFIFLEDGEWETADAYCEACLDKDPELAEAYLGKLMAELHVKTQNELKNLEKPFDDNANYKKIIRFCNEELRSTLAKYLEQIYIRNEDARKDDILRQAESRMTGNSIADHEQAIRLLTSIAGWKDADKRKAVCQQKLAELRKQAEEARAEQEHMAELERQRAAQAAQEALERKQKNQRMLKKYGPIAAGVLIAILLVVKVVIPGIKYSEADKLVEAGQYTEAIKAYQAIDDSEKTKERIDAAYYTYGEALLAEKQFDKAVTQFQNAGDYKDAKDRAVAAQIAKQEQINANQYNKAEGILAIGVKVDAYRMFIDLGEYQDSAQRAEQLKEEIQQEISVRFVAFNTDRNDFYDTINTSIPRSGDYLHYVFEVNGSNPGESYTLRLRETLPGKAPALADWAWKDVKAGDYKSGEWANGYNMKTSGKWIVEILIDGTDIVIGKYEMTVN